MSGTTPPSSFKPGTVLAREMEHIPAQERSAFLAHLDRKYRAAGDLEALREIRAYRRLLEEQARQPLKP